MPPVYLTGGAGTHFDKEFSFGSNCPWGWIAKKVLQDL